ncbi:hypothetical protein [Bacillus cereus]|uniref:hypothetical protein n=1 Tax=Bacillus cereus TaxID=1396 RepID=UPI000B4A6144|nr:hypothetical protein [Bacillus cereus]
MEQKYIEQLNKKIMEFDLNLINKDVVTKDINSVNDLLITKEKMELWRSEMQPGAVVICAKGDRYLIVNQKTNEQKEGDENYYIVNLNSGIATIDGNFHKNMESLLEYLILDFNNPIVKVTPKWVAAIAFAKII